MGGVIHRKDLDRIMNWLTNIIGPGLGDVFFVASANSAYETWYKKIGVDNDHLYSNVANAYAAATANRNDTILTSPEAHALTSQLTWAKGHTHMIGLGGPNHGGDYSEPNSVIYTSTANVANTIDLTGEYCQFRNLIIENSGNNANNVAAVRINKYGAYFKKVAFHGTMVANQCANVNCCSLAIGAAGMYPHLEDCIIGQDVWGERATANSGVLRFNGTGGRPNGGVFKDCQILSVGTTAACAMVAIPASTSSGRGWLFANCAFQHFDSGAANETLAQAFFAEASGIQKHSVLLHQCSAFGIDEWQTGDIEVVLATMPATDNGGALGLQPTAAVGA
jgi:hypothetical protein